MQLQSLLLSRDTEVARVLRPALEKLSIEMEVCSASDMGQEILSYEHFDAIVVDCEGWPDGEGVIRGLRKGRSNANSVMFALIRGETSTQTAFEWGASFVLQKPLSPLSVTRSFHAALGLMIRERRRYFRHPVEMLITLQTENGKEQVATAINLSEGGMAVSCDEPPPAGKLKLEFFLPGTQTPVTAQGELAWVAGNQGGIRFHWLAHHSRDALQKWLGQQMGVLD
jgi:DNA-binding response OmpR family regulator